MDNHAAKKWLKDVRRGKHSAVPVMFFGTFEICWSSASSIISWQRGSELGFKVTPKRDKRLAPSIEQVTDLSLGLSWDP